MENVAANVKCVFVYRVQIILEPGCHEKSRTYVGNPNLELAETSYLLLSHRVEALLSILKQLANESY